MININTLADSHSTTASRASVASVSILITASLLSGGLSDMIGMSPTVKPHHALEADHSGRDMPAYIDYASRPSTTQIARVTTEPAVSNIDLAMQLASIHGRLMQQQTELDVEAERLLYENLPDLYA